MKKILCFLVLISMLLFPISNIFAGFVSRFASCSNWGTDYDWHSTNFQNTLIDYTLDASRYSAGEGIARIRTNEPWQDLAIASPDNGKFFDSEVGEIYISAYRQVVIEAWADCSNGGSAAAEATYSW